MNKTFMPNAVANAAFAATLKPQADKPQAPAVGEQLKAPDARMLANTLAAEVMAHAQVDSKVWLRFGWRLIEGTTDMRAQFVKVLDDMLKDMRKVNAEAGAALDKDGKPDVSKSDVKQAASRVKVASVNVSCLRTIANAFNGAATIDDMLNQACKSMRVPVGSCTQEQIGWVVMVEYARTFSESKAGRKADPFLTKLAKWLDSAGKVADDNETELAQWKAVAELVAKLQK